MARVRTTSSEPKAKVRPALSPDARERQLTAMAYDLVEQRLRDGTASSQETTHFLKMGSPKQQLELERLREENKLLRAKTEALESAKNVEELYKEAIIAMRRYGGHGRENDDEY